MAEINRVGQSVSPIHQAAVQHRLQKGDIIQVCNQQVHKLLREICGDLIRTGRRNRSDHAFAQQLAIWEMILLLELGC